MSTHSLFEKFQGNYFLFSIRRVSYVDEGELIVVEGDFIEKMFVSYCKKSFKPVIMLKTVFLKKEGFYTLKTSPMSYEFISYTILCERTLFGHKLVYVQNERLLKNESTIKGNL